MRPSIEFFARFLGAAIIPNMPLKCRIPLDFHQIWANKGSSVVILAKKEIIEFWIGRLHVVAQVISDCQVLPNAVSLLYIERLTSSDVAHARPHLDDPPLPDDHTLDNNDCIRLELEQIHVVAVMHQRISREPCLNGSLDPCVTT